MLKSCEQGHYIGMTFKYYLPLGLIIVVWSIAFQGVLILHSLYKAGVVKHHVSRTPFTNMILASGSR